MASGLQSQAEETQVNALIYCMGDEAEVILGSFELSEGDTKQYQTVRSKFDAHFIPRRNIIYERAKFTSCKQKEGEPVDTFIMALHTLFEHCGYGALRNEMIRDWIVVGIRNTNLSEKLQLVPDLTLEQATMQVLQAEVVKLQQPALRGGGSFNLDTHVSTVYKGQNKARQPFIRGKLSEAAAHSTVESSSRCTRCGRHQHTRLNNALLET